LAESPLLSLFRESRFEIDQLHHPCANRTRIDIVKHVNQPTCTYVCSSGLFDRIMFMNSPDESVLNHINLARDVMLDSLQ
jgi:hypothetical protein